MEDIIKIVKPLEEFGLLLKGVIETIENEVKEQKGVFLSMLLRTFGANLLGNILVGKGVIRAGNKAATKKKGIEIVRACYRSKRSSIKKSFECLFIL